MTKEIRKQTTCKPLNSVNHLAYKYLEQVQKAVVELNYLGLEVKEIEFFHAKPRIIVQDNSACAWLEHSGRAIEYGFGTGDGGRYRKMQIMVAGIKVMWETARRVRH